MRRIKNWKTWITESLEQNPLTNLPDGVTLYTNRIEATEKKEQLFFDKRQNKKDKREEWNTSQSDYLGILKLSKKYNLKLRIDKYTLYVESNVGVFSIIKISDYFYWLEKLSNFFGAKLLSFEIDQYDSLISLIIQILESGDTSPEISKEIFDEAEIAQYHNVAWQERQADNIDDWKGNWTDEEIEKLSNVSGELREIFTNHYNFFNGIFQIYARNNTFILTKLSNNEYWIEKDASGNETKDRYFLVTGINSLVSFIKTII